MFTDAWLQHYLPYWVTSLPEVYLIFRLHNHLLFSMFSTLQHLNVYFRLQLLFFDSFHVKFHSFHSFYLTCFTLLKHMTPLIHITCFIPNSDICFTHITPLICHPL